MARGTVNKVILIGRLGADPELKYTPSGVAVTNFNIATNEVWKDKDGNLQERTEWHRLVLWQKLAERANEYLKKGNRVYIEGQLRTRNWDDKDGVKRYTTEVFVQNMQFLESREGSSSSSTMPPPPSEDDMSGGDFASNASDDDLPF